MHTLTSKFRIGKMIQIFVAVGIVADLLAFPHPVLADYSIAQEARTGGFSGGDHVLGQSFTTIGEGWVTQIDIYMFDSTSQPIDLRIYTDAVQPNNPLSAIYTQRFTPNCGSCWYSIGLLTPLAVNASSVYTFELKSYDEEPVIFGASSLNPYPGGSLWGFNSPYIEFDFAFRIWVSEEIYPNPGPRCYVNHLATGGNTGLDWKNAYTDLQYALQTKGCTEIWVAEGTYKPTNSSGRSYSFGIPSGVSLFGGFAGTENQLNERDWVKHPTILSGDIGSMDNFSDNSYHVTSVKNSGEALVTIDGFIIEGGNANLGSPVEYNRGGGIYIAASRVFLRNLIFRDNFAFGGGGFFSNGGTQTLSNVVFYHNTASMNGGGLHTFNGSTASLSNVTFVANTSNGSASGGIAIWDTSQVGIYNTILWGNTPTASPIYRNGTGGIADIATSLVENGCPVWSICQKVISNDPQFVNAANGNLRLQLGSPAVDAGANSFIVEDRDDLDGDDDVFERLPYDLDREPRIVNKVVDLGAFEFGAELFLPTILR